jgi:hypothetical protein
MTNRKEIGRVESQSPATLTANLRVEKNPISPLSGKAIRLRETR